MNYEEFDEWVRKGMDLFGKDRESFMYDFLYGIQNFKQMQNSDFRLQVLKKLGNFSVKNIKQITVYDITNLRNFVFEIKDNIITNSPFSIYFLINSLAERICDGIISYYGEEILKDKQEEIANLLKEESIGNYSMFNKIKYVKEIISKKGSKDGKQLILYLELLKGIRNKFIFHFLDSDEYHFIYSDEEKSEKEENLILIFNKVLDRINSLLETIDSTENELESHILENMKKNLGDVIKLLDEYIPKKGVGHCTSNLYSDFSENFVYIAYSFILFLGRENLKLFN